MTGAMKFKTGIKYKKAVSRPKAQSCLECSMIKIFVSSLLAISTMTSQVNSLELNQAKSKKGTMILPPGMIIHRGIVPSQLKKYFADKESETVVPANMEFDFLTRLGKSVFLISSTMTGTRNIEVNKR